MLKLSDSQLAAILAEAKQETARRSRAAVQDSSAIIKGHEAAKRAVLIAAAGGHSLLLVGGPDTGKTMLRALAMELGMGETFEARPCPCGYRNDPGRACPCKPPQVAKHLRNLPAADMFIEVCRVPAREMETRLVGTTASMLREQIAGMGPPLESAALCSAGSNLLRAAVSEMGLSNGQRETALAVAETIARLDASDRIRVEHIAEAVNYRFPSYAI